MPLTWDVSEIADHDTVTIWIPDHDDPNGRYKAGARLWNPVTEVLVMLSMATGISKITPDNADEVYARINILERVNGPTMFRAVDPETGERPEGAAAFIKPEEVKAHVGLSTNASPKTRAQFLKSLEGDLDDAKRHYVRATKVAEETAA